MTQGDRILHIDFAEIQKLPGIEKEYKGLPAFSEAVLKHYGFSELEADFNSSENSNASVMFGKGWVAKGLKDGQPGTWLIFIGVEFNGRSFQVVEVLDEEAEIAEIEENRGPFPALGKPGEDF